jgi:hypothetical protein
MRAEPKLNVLEIAPAQEYAVNYIRMLFNTAEMFFSGIGRKSDQTPDEWLNLLKLTDESILPQLAFIDILLTGITSRLYGGEYMGDKLAAAPDETYDRWQVKEAEALKIIGWLKVYKALMKRVGNKIYPTKRERSADDTMWEDSSYEVRLSYVKDLFIRLAGYFLFFSMDAIREQILFGKPPEVDWWDYEGADYP